MLTSVQIFGFLEFVHNNQGSEVELEWREEVDGWSGEKECSGNMELDGTKFHYNHCTPAYPHHKLFLFSDGNFCLNFSLSKISYRNGYSFF